MITQIIKRDGSIEPFSADKLNKWAEWASEKLGKYVNWSTVAMNTVSILPEKVTAKQLQEQLIKSCLDQGGWSYNLMAGRLYAPMVAKDIHGGEYPSVKELHQKLIKLGLMVDFGATDEDFEYADKIIKHEKNIDLPYFQQHYILNKYALKNRVEGIIYETPQYVFMRMALELSVHEQDVDKRKEHISKFYKYFSDGKLNAPTPNYTNLGTALRGFASCNIMTTNDSAASLAAHDHIAYTMTYQSAGIGSHVNTRSLGDPVRGGSIAHLGKLPLYRALSASVKAMTQNSRGGSATTYYNCYDPEIETIIRLKNPMSTEDKRIRGLDYALQTNRLFARKVARNEDIFLFNSFTAPDLYAAFYSGDEDLFDEIYSKYENNKRFKKTYVNARDIILEAMSEAYNTGRAYLHFPSEANRHTPFNDTVYSSNLCVAPETLILTDKGHVKISELHGKQVSVWNGEEWSSVNVVKTGENQELIKVETNSGFSVECTPYHKFYVKNSYHSKPVEKRAFELVEGDKLIKLDTPVIEGYKNLDKAYINGFYTGVGCEVDGKSRIYLYGEKRELTECFQDKDDYYIQDNLNREYFTISGLEPKFFVPSSEYTMSSRVEWFAGLLDSDGCLTTNGKSQNLQIVSTNPDFLRETQLMLQTLGVQSKVVIAAQEGMGLLPANDGSGGSKEFPCKRTERLLINGSGIIKLIDMGLNNYTKRIKPSGNIPNRDSSHFIRVSSVTNNGRRDDTYCFTEPKRNMGVFNGILAGNCLEIELPTSGYNSTGDLYKDEDVQGEVALCSLAGICVDKITSDEEYRDVMYYALLMIDRCIHLSHYELPHVGYTAKRRLNAGVGIIGLAHYMAKNKLSYSSQEGKNEIHRLSEKHMYFAIEASLRLSKEFSVAPWIDKTKWVDGYLPIDSYNKNVDNTVTIGNELDWESLRQRVIENGGIRNSALIAHMPSESSSKASGTTNGLYPVRDVNLQKMDASIVSYWSAPNGDKLEKWYESAWTINWKDMVDVYAIVQKFTDQGISADLWADVTGNAKVGSSEMINQYLYLFKMGMKSRYYLNSKTSKGVDNQEVDYYNSETSEEDCDSCTL